MHTISIIDAKSGKSGTQVERILEGTSISPGLAFGRPCFINEGHTADEITVDELPRDESHRLDTSFNQLIDQMNFLAEWAEKSLNYSLAEVFRAHRMIIENADLQFNIKNTLLSRQLSAEEAIDHCFNDYCDYFRKLDDEYLSSQSHDFDELRHLLLNLLNNSAPYLSCREYEGCSVGECVLGNHHIYITKELEANIAIKIREHTKGIIAEKCGKNSHGAIIARSLNIPVISGIRDIDSFISHDDDILINGNNGMIIINPSHSTLSLYQQQINSAHISCDVVDPVPGFEVLGEIDRFGDVQHIHQTRAEGIGLYRTEYEVLSIGHELTLDEQIECYVHVINQLENKPLYLRLFDLGGDKTSSLLGINEENNPALGCRGARLLLTRQDLLINQARAIARVSQKAHINVIYPMIYNTEQFLQLKNIFMEAIAGIDNVNISHGIMFEVPSACFHAEKLYQEIDFGCIGSNDLIQYLFAFDRTSDDFPFDTLADDPAIWQIIDDLVAAAGKAGKPLKLCGGMASNPALIPKLIRHGIRMVSVRPESIAAVRRAAIEELKNS